MTDLLDYVIVVLGVLYFLYHIYKKENIEQDENVAKQTAEIKPPTVIKKKLHSPKKQSKIKLPERPLAKQPMLILSKRPKRERPRIVKTIRQLAHLPDIVIYREILDRPKGLRDFDDPLQFY
jgi:hypothetical protein